MVRGPIPASQPMPFVCRARAEGEAFTPLPLQKALFLKRRGQPNGWPLPFLPLAACAAKARPFNSQPHRGQVSASAVIGGLRREGVRLAAARGDEKLHCEGKNRGGNEALSNV